MRQFILMGMLIGLAACTQHKAAEPQPAVFDEKAETTALMKTIDDETRAFYRRDYEGWKKTFVQADYVFQGWNFEDGTMDARTGWQNVDAKIGAYIREHPVPAGTASHPLVEKRNLLVHFFGDRVVYLSWDQYNSDKDSKFYWHSKEQRIMEKINGEWKVANVSAFWDYKNTIPVDSL